MSLTYGFYDSINRDRVYNAQQMSSIFDGIINDGVFESVGTYLTVKASSGMIVNVGVGRAWFNHTWTNNDAQYPITIESSEVGLSRIDAVVLEVNNTSTVRANSLKVVKGTAASSPEKPTLTETDYVHQHALAYITVGAGVTEITDSVIENNVGTSDCPFVTGILETANIDELLTQWETQFNEWFADLKVTLDDNVAANLLNKINENKEEISDLNSNLTTENDVAFKFCYDSTTQKYGYKDGADTFCPFSTATKAELLWTNPSPTSSIGVVDIATISNLYDYEYVLIKTRYGISYDYEAVTMVKAENGIKVALGSRISPSDNYTYRTVTFNGNTIKSLKYDSADYVLPTKIYGLKSSILPD